MNSHCVGQRRKNLADQKADRLLRRNDAVRTSVDRIHQYFVGMLRLDSRGDHGGRKTIQRPDFDGARWSQDTYKRGQKKAVAEMNRPFSSGISLDRAQKIDLARRRFFFCATQELGEEPML